LNYKEINCCRACGSYNLEPVVDLGEHPYSGYFPSHNSPLEKGPLALTLCENCSLVQLTVDYELSEMYGENYGYRSGLNSSMVKHLESIVAEVINIAEISETDLVVDIGSNDGTLLGFYPDNVRKIGIDPSGAKFEKFYKPNIEKHFDFFDFNTVGELNIRGNCKAITSLSMLYDVPRPTDFVMGIKEALQPDGLWIFEQSYLLSMIKANAYDTICHEHLEYYSLTALDNILKKCGLKITDARLTGTNGGSILIVAAHESSEHKINYEALSRLFREEQALDVKSPALYHQFFEKINHHRLALIETVEGLKREARPLYLIGASTKGNTLINYSGFTSSDFLCAAEVNEFKFGKFMPGSAIPICNERELEFLPNSVGLVLPWHFKDFFIKKPLKNVDFLFPLPDIKLIKN
jgi:hypothetical protein